MTDKNNPDISANVVCDEHSAVACTLRDVAREAARQWGAAHIDANPNCSPEAFGEAVAEVFLTALAGINAGFAPADEPPVEARDTSVYEQLLRGGFSLAMKASAPADSDAFREDPAPDPGPQSSSDARAQLPTPSETPPSPPPADGQGECE